jgi:hypothetical protein
MPIIGDSYPLQLADGTVVRNINQLIMALDNIDEETFIHHVNKFRNDFSEWIFSSLGEKDLSHLVSRLSSKQEIKKVLKNYIISKGAENNA